jgi:hypothetical protein
MEAIASEFPDLYQWFEAPQEVITSSLGTEVDTCNFDTDMLNSR